MKKMKLLLILGVFVGLSVPRCQAKDEYYFYKAVNTKASSINANIENTIMNRDYKIIGNDKNGNFYFIPVQFTFWDWFYDGQSRIRSENYFAISTKQNGSDCYIVLSKNYITPRRKLIILNGIKNNEIKLQKINKNNTENQITQKQLENFKSNTQLIRAKMVEELWGGKLWKKIQVIYL